MEGCAVGSTTVGDADIEGLDVLGVEVGNLVPGRVVGDFVPSRVVGNGVVGGVVGRKVADGRPVAVGDAVLGLRVGKRDGATGSSVGPAVPEGAAVIVGEIVSSDVGEVDSPGAGEMVC
jgi:hypothetical protein